MKRPSAFWIGLLINMVLATVLLRYRSVELYGSPIFDPIFSPMLWILYFIMGAGPIAYGWLIIVTIQWLWKKMRRSKRPPESPKAIVQPRVT